MTLEVVKVILPAVLAFLVGIGITPTVSNFLYTHKIWKKKAKTISSVDGTATPIFNKLHKDKEVNTPRMGGIVIWLSAFLVISLIWFLSRIWMLTDFQALLIFDQLDILSRNQTWIPLATLMLGAGVGLFDDWLEVRDEESSFLGKQVAGGLSLKIRLAFVTFIGILVSMWFYFKLDITAISFPGFGLIEMSWFIIPFFTLVIIGLYAGGVIDGVDGLSGGVFASMFAAYGVIAFAYGQFNLAGFCALLVGSILAFLWFNIPPARFYMTETGSMALTMTLGVVAFMTDSIVDGYGIFVLPIIALPLVITVASVVIQVLSKKFRNGKKVFLSAPIHHHFEAIGWPSYKVTMRYWVFSAVCATIGIILALIL